MKHEEKTLEEKKYKKCKPGKEKVPESETPKKRQRKQNCIVKHQVKALERHANLVMRKHQSHVVV